MSSCVIADCLDSTVPADDDWAIASLLLNVPQIVALLPHKSPESACPDRAQGLKLHSPWRIITCRVQVWPAGASGRAKLGWTSHRTHQLWRLYARVPTERRMVSAHVSGTPPPPTWAYQVSPPIDKVDHFDRHEFSVIYEVKPAAMHAPMSATSSWAGAAETQKTWVTPLIPFTTESGS
jgi:hypothetical protein